MKFSDDGYSNYITQGQLGAYYFNDCNMDIKADNKHYNMFVYAKDGEFAYALNE